MKRNFLFIVAIALAVPYMTALADGDSFDLRQDEQRIDRTDDRIIHDDLQQDRDLSRGNLGGALREDWRIDKNEAQLPEERRDLNQGMREWHYDRE